MNSARRNRKHWFISGIRGRMLALIIQTSAGILLLGIGVVYVTGKGAIQGSLGKTFCQIANYTAARLDDRYLNLYRFMLDVSTDRLTVDVVNEQNQFYHSQSSVWIEIRRERLIREWSSASGETARKKMLQVDLSRRLSVMQGLRADFIDMIDIYDRNGLLVAASVPPIDRDASYQDWFKSVKSQRKHFSYLKYNSNPGYFYIVIPIWSGTRIIGYEKADIFYKALTSSVNNVGFGKTGRAVLVDSSQGVFQSHDDKNSPGSLDGLLPSLKKSVLRKTDWFKMSEAGESTLWQRLSCASPLSTINATRDLFDQPPWYVVVTQAPNESYLSLVNSLSGFAVVGVLGIVLFSLSSFFMAWRIIVPIRELRDGVRRFAMGDRQSQVAVSSITEIGDLGEEFNHMASRINSYENELKVFEQAVEGADDAIIMTNPKGVIYFANSAFEEITGYSLSELLGKNSSMLRDRKTPDAVYSKMWDAISNGVSWRGELWNRRKNGEVYPVELSISPIMDDQENVMAMIGIHRDITRAREYQQSLESEVEKRTREIAENRGLTVIGEMASMIAHDLRNPLSTIKMNVQILFRRHHDASDPSREHCQMALDQTLYMEAIINDLLSFARPEKPRADWCDALRIVDDTLNASEPQILENKIKVDCCCDKRVPKVFCDYVKIMQVLRNLIDNAIQAMPDGGHLSIAATYAMKDPPVVKIEISDTGPGIDKETLSMIFKPFFTTRTKGTGLGLPIVKKIVEQHGGSIEIRSTLGKGTTLAFSLPTMPF